MSNTDTAIKDIDLLSFDIENEPELGSQVTNYFKEISKYPILSEEEEKQYFSDIKRGTIAAKQLKENKDTLSKEERDSLQLLIDTGKNSKEQLILHNLRFVVYVAKYYRSKTTNASFMDIIQEGNLGLSKAIDNFDADKGYRLTTYATGWIRNSIRRCIYESDNEIHIPEQVISLNNRLFKQLADKEKELGHSLSYKEMLDIVKDETLLTELLHSKNKMVSMNKLVNLNEEDGSEIGDLLPDEKNDVESEIEKKVLSEKVDDVMDKYLNEREAAILRARYGFENNGEQKTLLELSEEYGISRERIRQIELTALRKLKKNEEMNRLKDYIEL